MWRPQYQSYIIPKIEHESIYDKSDDGYWNLGLTMKWKSLNVDLNITYQTYKSENCWFKHWPIFVTPMGRSVWGRWNVISPGKSLARLLKWRMSDEQCLEPSAPTPRYTQEVRMHVTTICIQNIFFLFWGYLLCI